MNPTGYDPFAHGPWPVGVHVFQARDRDRDRLFPTEVRHPARPGPHPLVVYSHGGGGHRRSATFLGTHLASHGYAVATLDHSEIVAADLAPREAETRTERTARIDAIIASRVPDVRFLLDHLLDGGGTDLQYDPSRIGLVGHSFGGWTVLATTEVEPRIRAVVAHAPGGSTNPQPGVLPLPLTLDWGRDVPTLYLAAEYDVPIPPTAVQDIVDRTPATTRLVTLGRADHQHFVDDVEGTHETVRATQLPAEAAWMAAAMRPITDLCTGEHAHAFVRGLTLAHLDATLRVDPAAHRFLTADLETELARRGIEAVVHAGRSAAWAHESGLVGEDDGLDAVAEGQPAE